MRPFRFASTDSDRERRMRRSRIWMRVGIAFFVVVLIVAGVGIWLAVRHKEHETAEPESAQCAAIQQDSERFDCHPDRIVTKESCLKRGCCFRPASDLNVKDTDLIKSRFLGLPSCFFPKDYSGYFFNSSSISILEGLPYQRWTNSGFPGDVQEIKLIVTPIDDYRLRIRIEDAETKRFEPEVPVHYQEKTDKTTAVYSTKVEENGILRVYRRTSNQTVFESDIRRLIFSEYFIQLSTTVASKFIYGLGEQKEKNLKSNFNWQRYTLFNQGDLPVPNRNLYGSHPFFLVADPQTAEAYGIFLLNSNAMDIVLQPTPAVTFRTIGGILDFFIFLGPSPGDVVSQYTSLFGSPNFPPRWSLGFHLCKYGYFTLNKTKEVLNRNLDNGLPIDVQWHDIDYMMETHLDFSYNPDNFSGLPDFVDELHENGRHYVAMISPGVSNSELKPYEPYDQAKALNLFVKKSGSNEPIEAEVWNKNYTVFPDFSNPLTANYWKKLLEKFHSSLHFDGVWLDMNEPLNFNNGSTREEDCPQSIYDDPPYTPGRPYPLRTLTLCMSADHNKTKHYNEHNLLAYRENKATHSAMSEITGKRPFIISRASFSGQGIYGGHWSGDITSDWDDLRYTIPTMLSFSLYGMPMTGSDICGFRENTTNELCARWQSLGAFYPFSRNHNDFDTIEQDPAAMGKEVLASAKNALKIRYYLIPYLYTLFYKNHISYETVARPIFFEFPEDQKTYDIEYAFLWGPALLILPALEPGINKINPYIPKDIWYDLKGKKYSSSGENIEFAADLTSINVLLRGGYILPSQKGGNTTTDSALNPFDLLVALDSNSKATGELFWDDGETLDNVKNEKYNLIKMSVDQNTLKISPEKKSYQSKMDLGKVKVYGLEKKPSNVTINDVEVNCTFNEHKLLSIIATGYTLLEELTVTWG